MSLSEPKGPTAGSIEVCILAGGLSSRMGQDKARLVLRGRTLLSHIRATVRRLGLPVRVIRRDLTPGCGPIGGVFTALQTSKADAVLFLSCDMPFVSDALLKRLVSARRAKSNGTFVVENGTAGFPFLLNIKAVAHVETLLSNRQFSLQNLAAILKAEMIPPCDPKELLNINTPEDWRKAQTYS